MRVCSFLCSDALVYTSFFFFLFYAVFIHVIVHVHIVFVLLLVLQLQSTNCLPYLNREWHTVLSIAIVESFFFDVVRLQTTNQMLLCFHTQLSCNAHIHIHVSNSRHACAERVTVVVSLYGEMCTSHAYNVHT